MIAVATTVEKREHRIFRIGANRYLLELQDAPDEVIEVTSDDPEAVFFIKDFLIQQGKKAAGDLAKKLADILTGGPSDDDESDKDKTGKDGDKDGGTSGCTTVTIPVEYGVITYRSCS